MYVLVAWLKAKCPFPHIEKRCHTRPSSNLSRQEKKSVKPRPILYATPFGGSRRIFVLDVQYIYTWRGYYDRPSQRTSITITSSSMSMGQDHRQSPPRSYTHAKTARFKGKDRINTFYIRYNGYQVINRRTG